MHTGGMRGTATWEQFQGTRFFGALDALRAVSVIAVIWHHTSGLPGPGFFSKGYFGVDFFFAISGFLITTLLLREYRRHRRVSLRAFYIRRFFRIMPIYYLVLAAYVVLTVLTRRGTPEAEQFFANLPAFLTYTSNWFVDLEAGEAVTFYFAWSLATEEQFYVFWPPLLVLILVLAGARRSRATLALVAAVAALVTVSQAVALLGDRSLPGIILGSLALPILLGAAGAVLLDDEAAFGLLSPVLSAIWFAPLVFAAVLASLIWSTPPQLTQVLMVAAVISVCIRETTLLHPVLSWRPLAYVGTISYGIYLMHMLCANVLRIALPERFGILLFVLTSVLVIVVATVSFRIVEMPLQRWGRRFSDRAMMRGAGPRRAIVDEVR